MTVIMPMAGKGTRLLPLTKRVPKPLVNVAGRPVMDYVMDALRRAGQLDELIIITGHLKEKVEAYVRKNYDIPARFIEQKVLDGTAGAVNLARPYVDGPVIVIFVDTLFDADLSLVKTTQADGIIWTKEVEDYQRFGVVVTDKQGHMTKIVEKPNTPISKRANIGLQYVQDWRTLFDGIEHVLKSPPGKGGEFYLTDAFQYMVDKGKKLFVSEELLPRVHHVLEGVGEIELPALPRRTRGRSSSSAKSAAGTTAARWIRCSKRTSTCSSTAAASVPAADFADEE